MDKKRRDFVSRFELNTSIQYRKFFLSVLESVESKEVCGIEHTQYQFRPYFGRGSLECYTFDGAYISFIDVHLTSDVELRGQYVYQGIELSYLMEGEQIIRIDGQPEDVVYETQECYLFYLHGSKGKVRYHHNKRFKEIKICLSPEFIHKHKLDEGYDVYTEHAFRTGPPAPICIKSQDILSEILTDRRQGLLKRLFLESKILELLSLQLQANENISTSGMDRDSKSIKKIYGIRKTIDTHLNEHISIKELSREAGLNDNVVKKEFKRLFGETIFEYALNQRMDKACRLLKHSQKPIYEISEIVGYKNATHFTAAFKKNKGTTPKKYRNTE